MTSASDAQDTFRVSPWVTYNPIPGDHNEPLARSNAHFYNMPEDRDVDMDAPQISTLREEDTPEPQPARTSKFRVKLLVNDGKRSGSSGSGPQQQVVAGSDEEDEEEDEEDQLIDDDDDDLKPPRRAPIVPQLIPSMSMRGSPARRGRGRGGRRKATRAEHNVPPTMSGLHSDIMDVTMLPGGASTMAPQPTRRGRGGPGSRGGGQRAIRKRPSKVAKTVAPVPRDEIESVMGLPEGYPPTATSSPLLMPYDERTPELEILGQPTMSTLNIEDGTLEGVPLPIYPLPSKPFPVQPPAKIGTGFASSTSLDKSGKPVRRWRQVNREVRGIAGGRWFTRTWVGEKESEFASAQAAASQAFAQAAAEREAASAAASAAALAAAGITLPPKLAAISAPTTMPATASGKGAKSRASKAEAAASNVPSRSDSMMPESASAHRPKKRGSAAARQPADISADPLPAS